MECMLKLMLLFVQSVLLLLILCIFLRANRERTKNSLPFERDAVSIGNDEKEIE